MRIEPNQLQKARYYSSVGILYVATLLFAVYIFNPFASFGRQSQALAYSPALSQPSLAESLPSRKVITSKPVKLVIASLAIDLPVDDGIYNEADQSWSLSAKHAQFALPSMYANNIRGSTLIYGHYNAYVFYHLKEIKADASADVYTDNGHVFTYSFQHVKQLKPDDVSVFEYQGYPSLILQTCAGSFYEFRQLFYFTLQKIDGRDV